MVDARCDLESLKVSPPLSLWNSQINYAPKGPFCLRPNSSANRIPFTLVLCRESEEIPMGVLALQMEESLVLCGNTRVVGIPELNEDKVLKLSQNE